MARIISVDMVKQVVRKKERNEYLLRTYSMPSIAIGTLFFKILQSPPVFFVMPLL